MLLHRAGFCCALLSFVYSAAAVGQVQEVDGTVTPGLCQTVLDQAEQRYVEADYPSAELLALECTYHSGASDAHRQQAYRLLALSSIKQGLIADAQQAIVRILAIEFAYEPDVVRDPPAYVALVAAVKEQLRVAAPEVEPASGGPDEPEAPVVVNVNTGTAEELDAVPGIGPLLAERIIGHRDRYGPFRQVQDLQEVSGIGPRSLERMAPHLTTEESTRQVVQAGGGVPEASETLPVAEQRSPAEPSAGRPLVNLNTASAVDLESLDGIGPALAARIIRYREAHGPFRRIEDVTLVRGIGPRTFGRFAALVTVE